MNRIARMIAGMIIMRFIPIILGLTLFVLTLEGRDLRDRDPRPGTVRGQYYPEISDDAGTRHNGDLLAHQSAFGRYC